MRANSNWMQIENKIGPALLHTIYMKVGGCDMHLESNAYKKNFKIASAQLFCLLYLICMRERVVFESNLWPGDDKTRERLTDPLFYKLRRWIFCCTHVCRDGWLISRRRIDQSWREFSPSSPSTRLIAIFSLLLKPVLGKDFKFHVYKSWTGCCMNLFCSCQNVLHNWFTSSFFRNKLPRIKLPRRRWHCARGWMKFGWGNGSTCLSCRHTHHISLYYTIIIITVFSLRCCCGVGHQAFLPAACKNVFAIKQVQSRSSLKALCLLAVFIDRRARI